VAQVAPDLAQILARVEALEERLGRVESELAAVREERDRAEQQLASQAEELRVQRAAIARTQRVVRGLVNPEGGEGRPGGSSRP
jgi:septal ring factor EnvC (AmiA/AmiB activator)